MNYEFKLTLQLKFTTIKQGIGSYSREGRGLQLLKPTDWQVGVRVGKF